MENNSSQPSKWVFVISLLIINGLAWLSWPPLGAIFTIMSLGYLRKIVIVNSLHWEAPRYPVIFGHIAGGIAAVVTQLSAHFSMESFWSHFGLTILGFMAVGYIGYGVPRNPILQDLADSYRLIAQGAAVISYLVVSAIILGLIFIPFR